MSIASLPRAARLLLLACLVLPLAGCGYTIKGVVVRGEMSFIQWVPAGSPPPGEPIEGASVVVVRDADRMRPVEAGRATSGPDGTFALSVDGFGAGWMEESWLIRGSKSRAGSAEIYERLPSSPDGLLLVITLGGEGDAALPWRGTFDRRETGQSLREEVERYR